MKKIILSGIASLMLCSAYAATNASSMYIGPTLGWAFPAQPDDTTAAASSHSNQNFTYGMKLAYQYELFPHFFTGVEASYLSLGKTVYEEVGNLGNGSIESTGLQLVAVGTYVLPSDVIVFAKAGAIDERTSADSVFSSVMNNGNSLTEREWLPVVAFGVGYAFNPRWTLGVQYDHIFGQNWNTTGAITKPMTQDVVLLSINRIFAL